MQATTERLKLTRTWPHQRQDPVALGTDLDARETPREASRPGATRTGALR